MFASARYRSASLFDVHNISPMEIMSLRIDPLKGWGTSLFSKRERVLLLLSTSFASSSKESPALLRRLQRNVPKSFISQIFPRIPKCSQRAVLRLSLSHFFSCDEWYSHQFDQ